ncbi:hypothetical protein HOLleu_00509 [Holothuria leucospilota]|uniref:Uncharacterized protein n=1 Tax=Holothuria leucospilota TaxID=206669 RepID=A0A9Q1CP39_HOLLE|nr:hypothetical protein HOLleu_00509 [Holothuria leucospilota]
MPEGRTSGSHQKRKGVILSSPLKRFHVREHLSRKHVDGPVSGYEISVPPEKSANYSNFSINNLNVSTPNLLCACGRCFVVTLGFRGIGRIHVDVKPFNTYIFSTKHVHNHPEEYSDVSYFVMKVQGDHEIWSTLISDQDVSLARLDPIKVSSSGQYNVFLTLIYTNKSSAYGLEKYQEKELHCPLCQTNGTCHITLQVDVANENVGNARSGWVPIKGDETEMPTNKIVVSDNGSAAYYFRSWKNDTFFECPTCEGSELLDKCLVTKKFMLLGDSHMGNAWKVLQKHFTRFRKKMAVQWRMRADGLGVYHNLSPDKDFKGYSQGKVPSVFVPGNMIKGLQSGLYYKLQQDNKFDAWIFSSGHWDLRDTSLDIYMSHLEELIEMWSEFQRTTGVWLVWNGMPAYSFNRDIWGGLEKRTNIKIALADHETKDLCKRYNITYVPFFDISFPFYAKSCDTHHYLCDGETSPIGSAQLNLLLQTICINM